jgi:hypothetical protein
VSLDINKLTNVRQVGHKTVAACPACREDQLDHRGKHLFISKDGRFGCVLHPGSSQAARAHRRRIWKLSGAKTDIGPPRVPKRVMVQRPAALTAETRVLGRFGRSPSSHAHACIGAVDPSLKSKEGASEASENAQFIELVITAFGMFNACCFQLLDRNGRPSASGGTVSALRRVLRLGW